LTTAVKGEERITSPDAVLNLNLHRDNDGYPGTEPTPLALG